MRKNLMGSVLCAMNDADADKILGKYKCICGYRNHEPERIKEHIEKFHPDLKKSIRDRYREMTQT